MNRRVMLPVAMELCSDTIFGSGFSIPGGEDIAVCRDRAGFPYIKGSTVKGLLRESLENLAVWTGMAEDEITALLGREGFSQGPEARRLRFTDLTLENPPSSPEDCCRIRTFTSLENGAARDGSLRTAACVRRGLVFTGELECGAEDVDLLRDALAGIRQAGTLRNRGLGSVRLRAGTPEDVPDRQTALPAGRCLRYRLHTDLPVIITDLARSSGNSFETQGFIPGSAVRGAVIGRLAARDPAWFEDHKAELLNLRFLDAVPVIPGAGVPLPSLRGFYEDKAASGPLDANTAGGAEVRRGTKRAALGSFCSLDGGEIRYWTAASGGAMRIRRGGDQRDAVPFLARYLEAGQDFEGYILGFLPEIAGALDKTLWLGADRNAGFGKCSVTLEAADRPGWLEAYGFRRQEEIGRDLYLLAVSPFTMLNRLGDPCGLDEQALARLLGVDRADVLSCAAALTENGSFNRTWQCRAPRVRMYDRGSLFRLRCSAPPALDAIARIQDEGLGIRRPEGFGQVLFLPPGLVEGVKRKREVRVQREDPALKQAAVFRRAVCRWVEETAEVLRGFRLSPSQLGTIQVLCEEARGGDCRALYDFLEHNLENRGAEHAERFREIDRLVRAVLEHPLEATVGAAAPEDSAAARLRLLSLLFNHSRKGKEAD